MAETTIDAAAEVTALSAALEAQAEPAYTTSIRRIIPSQMPVHGTRLPNIRRFAGDWSRAHRGASPADVLAVAEALQATAVREECLAAIILVGRRRDLIAVLPWEVIERWSAQIENWEQVDNLAGAVTGPMLRARPELIDDVEGLADSPQSWQRRLAIVTFIEAARKDPSFIRPLAAMADRLQSNRGPTLRKAVAWARKVLREQEAKVV